MAYVKSAILQDDDIVDEYQLNIFGVPIGDIRRRLESMVELKHDEILQMSKSAFGAVRATFNLEQRCTPIFGKNVIYLCIRWNTVGFCPHVKLLVVAIL